MCCTSTRASAKSKCARSVVRGSSCDSASSPPGRDFYAGMRVSAATLTQPVDRLAGRSRQESQRARARRRTVRRSAFDSAPSSGSARDRRCERASSLPLPGGLPLRTHRRGGVTSKVVCPGTMLPSDIKQRPGRTSRRWLVLPRARRVSSRSLVSSCVNAPRPSPVDSRIISWLVNCIPDRTSRVASV